ncbi:CBS domain-containing protein [Fusibacter sp. 3D3]|uniref:CBS domain-containing protein n=1 Tax=Fusibacter sp. 3D3 TaxID=1048380 RepID=UPI00085307B3|nr:CBS domain-containing protein [Fusibacter sp. 3D3]GAU77976.1 CBS domain protein [Fusibacter sp. 3D3]
MRIRAIMTPVNKLLVLSTTDSAGKALKLIEENDFLSLPVAEERHFIGFLSKQFIYETYFKENQSDFEAFLKRPVKEFIHNRVECVKQDLLVEEAADIFFKNKVRFLPVVNELNEFIGILTQKSLFGVITKVYGLKDPKISIFTDDFKGTLAKISEIISKNGGNITNIALFDTEVMGIQEISVRIVGQDIHVIAKKLEDRGFKVRDIVEGIVD